MKRLGERGIGRRVVATRMDLADAQDDAGVNAVRPGMMEYTRLRQDLSEARSVDGAVCILAALSVPARVREDAGLVLENTRLDVDVQDAYGSTISLLADAVQAKDAYTHGHCEQVSQYARAAADLLDLSADDKRVTCCAALLHDVGKIGVSDNVLNKPGPLIDEERTLVQAHVRIGHDLLMGVPALRDVAHAVLHHHERYDGAGYPAGLVGDAIPIASRIVAAIDAYCAMIDERSYKRAYAPAYAREELRRCAGSQFDPTVVDAVLKAIEMVDSDDHADRTTRESCGLLPPPLRA